MVDPHSTRFWHAAVQSGLIDVASLEACWARIPEDKRTPDAIDRRLARQTIEAGLFTVWQAQQLLAGVRPQGFQFGKYVILDVIGHGGMGRVYLAKDTRLGRRVALKVLSRERMNNPRAIARFRREAKVGAQLQHENLVRIYDEGEAQGHHYLVMEFIEGKTVGKLMAENGQFPPPVAARIARQISLGLEHAHQKGLIHRDVNPMNILISKDGTAKLTDLGLAIDLADQEDIVTRDGATVGTFDYISPEQARHSRSVDTRSDIYSLGCTLFHMIAGRVPFPQPSLPEKLYAHQALDPEPLTELVPGVPEGLDAVVHRMMKKKPEARYETPLEVAQALEPYQSMVPAAVGVQGGAIAGGSRHLDPASAEVNGQAKFESGSTTPSAAGSDEEAVEKSPIPEVVTASNPDATPSKSLIPNLDLGPESSLSGSISGVRKAVSHKALPIPWKSVGIAAGALLLIVLIVWFWPKVSGIFSGEGSTLTNQVQTKDSGRELISADAAAKAPISVHWLDDNTWQAEDDVRMAIERAVGRNAEVVLRDDEVVELSASDPLRITRGRVVIRAAEGVNPYLVVSLPKPTPLFQVGAEGGLILEGLTVRCGTVNPKNSATIIESAGPLTLKRCKFVTTDTGRNIKVARTLGRKVEISGCWFENFDQPLTIEAYPNLDANLSHCLFSRDVPAATGVQGWAVSVIERQVQSSGGERRLLFSRCTLVDYGLLALEGLAPEEPLHVTVQGTVVRAHSMILWDGADENFPKALRWSGKQNRYAVSGAAWVVKGPSGINAIATSPRNLESWNAAMGDGAESESTPEPISFPSDQKPPGVSTSPEDYAVTKDTGGESLGIDPSQVGPADSTS